MTWVRHHHVAALRRLFMRPHSHESMATSSDRLTLLFSSLGHTLVHMFTALFFVVVLALEAEWRLPYHELIELWTPGAILVGLCALPAGWLADRWSAPGMMAVMFLGMGIACGVCASVQSPPGMLVGLMGLGAFASIYHPVGIPWIFRNASAGGRALGINGVFGGLGVAGAGGITGLLIDSMGWRAAFAVPGMVSLGAGLALVRCLRSGRLEDVRLERVPQKGLGRRQMIRGITILLFTMFALGFVYQASQVAFPKLFDLRLGGRLGEGTLGVGLMVSAVYGIAALMQLVGGYLADHYPVKRVYLACLLLQVPFLGLVARLDGWSLLPAAILAVMLSTAALPSENLLLARNSPRRHQSLIFGLKFVLALGTAPLAISFVSFVQSTTGGVGQAFLGLAVLMTGAFLVAGGLPGESATEPASPPSARPVAPE